MEKIDKLKKFFTKERYLVLLSLIATPFIIFVITAVDLYLKNQVDLDNRLVTLAPFLVLFAVTTLIGCLVYYYSKKIRIIKLFLFAYYLSGPAFLIYSAIRQTQLIFLLKIIFLPVLFSIILLYLYKKIKIAKIAKIFFWFSILMIISELPVIYNGVHATNEESQKNASNEIVFEKSTNKKLSNIYHIIFDEYQTDMFGLTLNQKVKDKLAGFTYYPNNMTLYGRTGMSLPSIFTGLEYDYKMPQIEYQKQAFNSDKSLLFKLKEAGYKTDAYTHKIYSFDMELFDSVIEHKKNTYVQLDNDVYIKLFLNLWTYANFPNVVSEKIIDPEAIDQIKAQNTLPGSTPVVNYESFNNILTNKKLLNSSNQYIFIHLIFPHFPYVFKPDCSYDGDLDTSPLEQSKCATKMIISFLDTLKELNRFDESMIIIQSDHGAGFKVENNDLVKIDEDFYSEEWSLARAKSLLLIKIPDKKSTDPLVISKAETSLLDITPTIIDALDIKTDLNPAGISLVDLESSPLKRSRYYHFFKKKGKNELTNELSRYIIKDGDIKFDRNIGLEKVIKGK